MKKISLFFLAVIAAGLSAGCPCNRPARPRTTVSSLTPLASAQNVKKVKKGKKAAPKKVQLKK